MTPEKFKESCRSGGYGAIKEVSFEPSSRSSFHTHDQESFVYVVSGVFILNTAETAISYQPGQTCILGPNIEHAEEAGDEGTTILVARR